MLLVQRGAVTHWFHCLLDDRFVLPIFRQPIFVSSSLFLSPSPHYLRTFLSSCIFASRLGRWRGRMIVANASDLGPFRRVSFSFLVSSLEGAYGDFSPGYDCTGAG